jgi:hypothetical protein
MPDTITCTSCRSAIDVPADHAEDTIRCGICWSENALAPKAAPVVAPAKAVARPVAQLLPPKPARPSAVTAIPAKAASGVTRLEGLIHKAAAKLAPPAAPPAPAAAQPILATVKPVVPEVVPAAKPAAPPPVAASPVPIPQAAVPTPVRVAPAVPPVVVQPLPAAAPVAAPVVVPSRPVEAPVPVTVAPLVAAPVVVPVTPAAPKVLDAEPVVQGEFADDTAAPKRPAKDERSRPAAKRRPRDDDDDDDRPRRRKDKGEANNASMVMMIVAGVAVLALLVVGVIYLSGAFGRAKTPDAAPVANADQPPPPAVQFNLPNPDGGPQPNANGNFGFNPFPPMQRFEPPRPKMNVNWVEHDADGFKAKLVERPTTHPSILRLPDDNFFLVHVKTKSLTARTLPPAVTVEVVTADVPQGVVPDLKKMAAEPFGRADKVAACKVAGKDGYEHVEAVGPRTTTTRVIQVGCRVFVFKLTALPPFGDKETIDEAAKTFWESLSITFDPATPAPVDPTLRRKNAPNNPFPPRGR